MALTLVLTKAELGSWWPISVNLDDARVNPWIARAQEARLQQLLGPSLYYALLQGFPVTAGDRFDKLLNGDTYKFDSNYDQRFPGVKELLSAYTYAFLVDNNAVHITRGGVQRKTTPELSENLPAQTISVKSQDAYSEAIRLEGEFYKYISVVSATYPEYMFDRAPKNSSQNFWNASRGRTVRYGLDEYYERNPNG